ncbi:hypothetical protein AB0L05_41790 [Nonomuraea pusilla]|uniref:hypothetical protein n=1 Tax=Nonomuraea pusilla TaxID=46177 RepID=UPI0033187064
MRPLVAALVATAVVTAACANQSNDTSRIHHPPNEGTNYDLKGVLHLRNAFLLSGATPSAAPPAASPAASPSSPPASPPSVSGPASPSGQPTGQGGGQDALFAVLINSAAKPDTLERITAEGGGQVQLPGPIELPPNQPVGAGNRPIASVTGVKGGTVAMTFSFRNAGDVRLLVPVMQRTGIYASLTPSPVGSPVPSPAGTAPVTTPSRPSQPSPPSSQPASPAPS